MTNHCDGHKDMVDGFVSRIERVESWERDSCAALSRLENMVQTIVKAVEEQRGCVMELKEQAAKALIISDAAKREVAEQKKETKETYEKLILRQLWLALCLIPVAGKTAYEFLAKILFG